MFKRVGLLCIFILVIAGCSKTFDDDEDIKVYKGMSEAKLYESAHEKLIKKDYSTAIKRYEALDSIYPFSRYAKPAQMDLIYAYYDNGDYAQAAATSERFIHLYPRDEYVDYAYYMRAMANFSQERGTFARFISMDVSWRSPGTQLQAYQDFLAIVKRFPHSKYYPDAMQHMIYLRNQFAKHELNIARFYYDSKLYVAALNRANYVLRHYNQSPQAKKALALSEKINQKLSLHQGASDDAKVSIDTYQPPKRKRV